MNKKLIKPDFNNNIVNVSASLAEFLGCPNDKATLPVLMKELEKNYKNIVFLILDGMGIYPINVNLKDGNILKRNIKQVLTSVFPSTTTSATTSFLTNQYPIEHGWFGMSVYFKELDRAIDIFLGKDSYTHEVVDPGYTKRVLPTEAYYKRAKSDYTSNVVVPGFWRDDDVNRYNWTTFDELFAYIEEVCNKEGKQFVYSYCAEPDHTMHEFGVSSKEAYEVINELNDGIEKLSSRLKDTLFVITADHGQIDIDGYIEIYKDEEILSMLEHPFILEPRATGMFVKAGCEERFEKVFNEKYGKDFKLVETKELIKENYFGVANGNSKEYLLPNYIAICVSHKMLLLSEDMDRFKGHHASLTEEMEVPLILIGNKN